jgi:hypothetical protein
VLGYQSTNPLAGRWSDDNDGFAPRFGFTALTLPLEPATIHNSSETGRNHDSIHYCFRNPTRHPEVGKHPWRSGRADSQQLIWSFHSRCNYARPGGLSCTQSIASSTYPVLCSSTCQLVAPKSDTRVTVSESKRAQEIQLVISGIRRHRVVIRRAKAEDEVAGRRV